MAENFSSGRQLGGQGQWGKPGSAPAQAPCALCLPALLPPGWAQARGLWPGLHINGAQLGTPAGRRQESSVPLPVLGVRWRTGTGGPAH